MIKITFSINRLFRYPIFLGILFTLIFVQSLQANSCQNSDMGKQFLPRTLGRPNSSIKEPVLLPCDTVIVRENDTCIINPGAMLHFGPQGSEKNLILVKGTLIAKGSQEMSIYLSGTVLTGDLGYVPGYAPWSGIQITQTGSVDFQRVRMFYAIPALNSKSENVALRRVVLQGCMNIIGPTGKVYEINTGEETIDTLNFRTMPRSKELSTVTKTESQNSHSKISRPLAWSLAGLGLLAAGGGLFFLLHDSGKEAGPPTIIVPPAAIRPPVPGTPGGPVDRGTP